MSGINGDKARFNKDRKARIARRLRYQKLFKVQVAPKAAGEKATSKKEEEKVSA